MFAGKNIWIIGASSGIGAALAIALSNNGANVILSARREDKLRDILSLLKGEGHSTFRLDASNAEEVKSVIENIINKYGRIDSVIFMAASYKPHAEEQADLRTLKQIVDTNFTGVLNVVYSVLPTLKKQGSGQIVLCGSVAGFRGLPYGQPYCATKAAIINLAESLRVELDGVIDVRLISPGFVKTPLTDKNEFPMPFIISAEKAADYIVKGLRSKRFEIHFPRRFTYIMKIIKILPNCIYFMLAKRLKGYE